MDGNSVVLAGTEQRVIDNDNVENPSVILTAQTFRLTFIRTGEFNYLQYRTLRCSQPTAGCPNTC